MEGPRSVAVVLIAGTDPFLTFLTRFCFPFPIRVHGRLSAVHLPFFEKEKVSVLSIDKFFGPRRSVLRAMAETEGAGTEHESQSCQTQDEPY